MQDSDKYNQTWDSNDIFLIHYPHYQELSRHIYFNSSQKFLRQGIIFIYTEFIG